jgi:hypothetical protein
MGKIVATYLVKVTLREPDDLEETKVVEPPFTNDEMVAMVQAGIAEKLGELTVNATSERVDI